MPASLTADWGAGFGEGGDAGVGGLDTGEATETETGLAVFPLHAAIERTERAKAK